MKNTDTGKDLATATKSELLKLERAFDAHYALTLNEMQTQKQPLDRMCVLSQRYLAISKMEPGQKQTKIEAAAPADDSLLLEFNEAMKLLETSSRRMVCSIEPLIASYKVLRQLCDEIYADSTESAFVTSDTHHKPLAFFIEHVDAFATYLSNLIIKLNYRRKLLDIEDSKTLTDYKALLVPSQHFEEVFHVALADMKCLRSSHVAAVDTTL